jgi:hypothetical protein
MTVVTARAHSARPVPNLNELPDDALLTDAHVSALTTFSVPTIKLWRKNKRGPRFVSIEGYPRCRAGDLRAWINGRSPE